MCNFVTGTVTECIVAAASSHARAFSQQISGFGNGAG